MAQQQPQIEYLSDKSELVCRGEWTIDYVEALEKAAHHLMSKVANKLSINGRDITRMDSAGGVLLVELQQQLRERGKQVVASRLTPECGSLLKIIKTELAADVEPYSPHRLPNSLAQLGKWAVDKCVEGWYFLTFIGQFAVTLCGVLGKPRGINWRSVLVVIDEAGYQALPIVALLTFLVGIVITYQMALELSTYGANIYIVDISGMIIFREFGPLITAIIAAGRTSTAFTAQIGTMKVNEELDALKTMGIPPFIRIVLPKVIGLLIALPLLVVWADIFGMLGTMLMAKLQLGIGYSTFLSRFEHQISVRHYVVGLVKVPVFALLIALVGSYQGFRVSHNADSVGQRTTASAVQSIFLIIIIDALFSVIFSMRGI